MECYCEGHCPGGDDQVNGSCTVKPGSYCFAAVEEVYNPTAGRYEPERSYGCLPPEEGGLMQCKGHLVPHQIPMSIECCNEYSYCNRDLKPMYVPRTPPEEDYAPNVNIYLITSILSICILFVLIFIAIIFLLRKFRRQFKDSNSNMSSISDEERISNSGKPLIKSHCGAQPLPDYLTDAGGISSGSGSGIPFLVQRTIAKQIEMKQIIGKGRYGEVWKGSWREEDVAVKVFFTRDEASWFREQEIYQTVLIRHENILGFIAADIRGNGSWTELLLITDYHENGSLYDFIQDRVLDEWTMLQLIHTAACGICHLHTEIFGKQGKPAIAHRDLKSKNILVKKDGITCVIADFGVATRYDSQTEEIDIAMNTRVGTKRYMPPEILDGSLNVNSFDSYKMADMYSFGLVVWEVSRRTIVNNDPAQIVDEYQLPYFDCVPSDPSFDEMKSAVCGLGRRPILSDRWRSHSLAKIISECQHASPTVRPSSLRVKKNLAKFILKTKSNALI